MSEKKGGCLKGLFVFIVAPLIVTIISGLVFEWFRSRTPAAPLAATAGAATATSPAAMMIIGKWNVDKSSVIYGEKAVEFTATGQMIRTTSAVIRGDNSTNYNYSFDDAGKLLVDGSRDVEIVKLTDDELALKWSGSLTSYNKQWPDWLRAVVGGGALFLIIAVSLMYQFAKRR